MYFLEYKFGCKNHARNTSHVVVLEIKVSNDSMH